MGTLDPDNYQRLLNTADELDDIPIRINRQQAQKCAAILTAGLDGHVVYTEATVTVARYLQELALDMLPGIARNATDSATLWKVLDDLPWPIPGPPSPQST